MTSPREAAIEAAANVIDGMVVEFQPLVRSPQEVARAAIEAYERAMWRPIEEAPKDYSVVFIYQPASAGNAEGVGQGHRTDLRQHAHDKWVFQATGWRAEPTHWRPLPAPPSFDTDKRDEA